MAVVLCDEAQPLFYALMGWQWSVTAHRIQQMEVSKGPFIKLQVG